jgi:predicted Zn-dependent protease
MTRGMLLNVQNEEELAGILAHEIGHVSNRDGSKAIQQARWMEVVTLLGTEAARKASSADMAKLVSLFEGSVQDVVKTLTVKGYSREQEGTADQNALVILRRLGYDPIGFVDFLGRLSRQQTGGRPQGLLMTHPGMSARVGQARSWILKNPGMPKNRIERDRRFQQVTAFIR